ncbi:amidohydrolase family protein [Streptomyces sp. NPDC102437]|uniref:amidohydrolase family protein n=1 Tax=Streptomyces sp. NPDC102437 TaxID=3366175 RepID=UPI00381B1BF1
MPPCDARCPAVPLRFPAEGRCHARGGRRPVREQPRPARRNPRRRQPDAARGDRRPGFLSEQRLDLTAAAYTAGSAHVNGTDDAATLRPGHLADLVVLDRDLFAEPAEEIHTARVPQTHVGGSRVYSAS